VTFEIPDQLTDKYSFEHGQFVNLRAVIDGETVERSYSICSAPYERKLSVAIKGIENGLFSIWANTSLSEGDELDVSLPMGNFTSELDSSTSKQYILIAAGSGITPIFSILKQTLAAETSSNVLLVYGNKSNETTMFQKELEKASLSYDNRFNIINTYSESKQSQYQGRITPELLDLILVDNQIEHRIAHVFICGPEQMTLALKEHLEKKNPDNENVRIELFNSSNVLDGNDSSSNYESQISIQIDDETIDFTYTDNTQTILETALDYDPDLPYGCQNGSCGACQAKVLKGEVAMDVNYALSESEVREGYILVCQSKPVSQKLIISYDEE